MSDDKAQKNMKTDTAGFSTLVFVTNSRATNATRADKWFAEIEALHSLGKATRVRFAASMTPKALAAKLSAADADTLICIGGGDGTTNAVINALLSEYANEASRSATLLPLWGGNANDLAIMLNGYVRTSSPKKLLTEAHRVNVRPLQLTLNFDGEDSRREFLGACYISFGLSAHAGWFMETSSHDRQRKFLLSSMSRFGAELKDLARVWLSAPVFQINRAGKRHEMYEIAFLNGSRFAKIERVPVTLVQPRYYYMDANRGHLHMLVYALRALVSQNHGYPSDDVHTFVLESDTKCQVDGEIMQLSAGTHVQVGLSGTSFRALSTRL